jgi:hypothetical protein
MRRLLRWYGANPLHMLALLGCFALAGYAAARLVPSRPFGVAVWFIGAVVGHDVLLMPLYTLADRSAMAVIRHRAPRLPSIGWINYVRVPAALSGLLLLMWTPLILRLRTRYHASTTLSENPYLWHWLGVTGALFLLSAAVFALRLRAARRSVSRPGGKRDDRDDHAASPGQHDPADQARGVPPVDQESQATPAGEATPAETQQQDQATEPTQAEDQASLPAPEANGPRSPEDGEESSFHETA